MVDAVRYWNSSRSPSSASSDASRAEVDALDLRFFLIGLSPLNYCIRVISFLLYTIDRGVPTLSLPISSVEDVVRFQKFWFVALVD